MESNIVLKEYLWAYDWWLSWMDKYTWTEYHRSDNSEILEIKQPKEYWPVYFKTESWYFKNLNSINEEDYESETNMKE